MSAVENLFYPHSIQFAGSYSEPPPVLNIMLLEDVTADRDYAITKHSSASAFAPCFIGVDSASPKIRWTTKELDVLFGAILAQTTPAIHPLGLVRSVDEGTVDLWYRAGTKFGFRDAVASASHIKCRMVQNAMLYWDTLNADPSIATVSANLVASFAAQGTDLMQVVKDQASLPDAACDDLYALSKVTVNGTELAGVQSVQWNNNVQVASRISAGETGPGYIGIDRTEPVVTVTTDDATELADSMEGGDVLTSIVVYLQRKSRTNFYTALANTDHISLTAVGGTKVVPSISGGPASVDLVCHIEQKFNNPLMTVALGVAIP